MRRAIVTLCLLAALPAAGQQLDPEAGHGREVYMKWCTPCHGSGPGKPGTMVLQARYGNTRPAMLEQRTDLPAEAIAVFVRQGVGIMPPFRKTEISDDDLAAISAYLASPRPEPEHTPD